MRKLGIILFMVVCNLGQSYAGTGKLIAGVLITLAGASMANSGFALKDVDYIEYVTIQDKRIAREWEFRYKYDTYDVDTAATTETYITDTDISTIAYSWIDYSYAEIGATRLIIHHYYNHHAEYGYVPVTSPITITTKESVNSTQGVTGIILASVGVNILFDYLNKDIRWFSKNNIKFHLAQYNDRVNLSLQYRI